MDKNNDNSERETAFYEIGLYSAWLRTYAVDVTDIEKWKASSRNVTTERAIEAARLLKEAAEKANGARAILETAAAKTVKV